MDQTIQVDRLDIRQDTSEEKFFLDMKGEEESYLKYDLKSDRDPNVVDFTETYIAPTLRGIGLAERFCYEGMRYAEKNSYKVKATCPVVKNYLEKHPEFQGMQVKN